MPDGELAVATLQKAQPVRMRTAAENSAPGSETQVKSRPAMTAPMAQGTISAGTPDAGSDRSVGVGHGAGEDRERLQGVEQLESEGRPDLLFEQEQLKRRAQRVGEVAECPKAEWRAFGSVTIDEK